MSAALSGFLFPWSPPSLHLPLPNPLAEEEFCTHRLYMKDFILWFQFVTKPVCPCHHRTQTRPDAVPQHDTAEMETHHHLPPRHPCTAGPDRCSVIPHPPCFSLISRSIRQPGALVNLPGRGCFSLSATAPSP